MIVLDANVMIAILDRADAHFEAALGLLTEHRDDALLTHRLTLAEALVLSTRAGRAASAARLLKDFGVEMDDALDDPLELASLRVESGLRMPDCCALVAARRAGAALATFDVRLARAARELGVDVVGA